MPYNGSKSLGRSYTPRQIRKGVRLFRKLATDPRYADEMRDPDVAAIYAKFATMSQDIEGRNDAAE